MRRVFGECKEIFFEGFRGNATEFAEACPYASGFLGGIVGGALIAFAIFLMLFLFAGYYVYTAMAWYKIAKKLKYKTAWLAWVPIVRIVMALEMGGFHWAWIFLIFIPFFGWIALGILFIISLWRIFEKVKQPGWFSLGILIPQVGGLFYLIAIGFAAWGKKNK